MGAILELVRLVAEFAVSTKKKSHLDGEIPTGYRAASTGFSPEMDSTCSQLHVGSGFLKKY